MLGSPQDISLTGLSAVSGRLVLFVSVSGRFSVVYGWRGGADCTSVCTFANACSVSVCWCVRVFVYFVECVYVIGCK